MVDWSIEDVAERFEDAAHTGRALPPVRVQGYFNVWPQIVREQWERLSADERPLQYIPPGPEDIERMLETMQWVLWLDVEQRHLVWMRARRCGWREITIRLACERTTAWRRWQRALDLVARKLNVTGESVRLPLKQSAISINVWRDCSQFITRYEMT